MYHYRIIWNGVLIDEVATIEEVIVITRDLWNIGMTGCKVEVIE